jgi:hypothetical protein
MVLALNTVSGQIADVPPKMLLHPKFKNVLVPVDENAKPYNSAMYKPGTVEEKVEERTAPSIFLPKKKKKQEEPVGEEVGTESNIDIEEEN